jgi:hypothetical protein
MHCRSSIATGASWISASNSLHFDRLRRASRAHDSRKLPVWYLSCPWRTDSTIEGKSLRPSGPWNGRGEKQLFSHPSGEEIAFLQCTVIDNPDIRSHVSMSVLERSLLHVIPFWGTQTRWWYWNFSRKWFLQIALWDAADSSRTRVISHVYVQYDLSTRQSANDLTESGSGNRS